MMTGFLIAVINYAFKFVLTYNAYELRISSITKETKVLKSLYTVISVFNKCIIIILIGANLEFTDIAFNGEFSDFNHKWF